MKNYTIHAIAKPVVENGVTYLEIAQLADGYGQGLLYPLDFSFDTDKNTYTLTWNNGAHAGTFTRGNYLYDNVTDALSKWQSGSATIPYFAVATPLGIKYYKIRSKKTASELREPSPQVEETTTAPTAAEQQLLLIAARKRRSGNAPAAKPYTQITGEAARYLDHVSGGVPYFTLPEGYTDDDFLAALSTVMQANPEIFSRPMGNYQDTPSVELDNSQTSTTSGDSNSNTITKSLSKTKKIPPTTGEVTPDKSFYLYAYPHNKVDIYSIHPDVYELVLKELSKQSPSASSSSNLHEYYLSPNPLTKVAPGGQMNDSTYHFINRYGKDLPRRNFAVTNPNLVSKGDVIISEAANKAGSIYGGASLVDPKYIHDGKVTAYTVEGPTGSLLQSPGVGINTKQPVKYVDDVFIPGNFKKFFTESDILDLAKSSGMTIEQIRLYLNLMKRTSASTSDHNLNFLYNTLPQENIMVDYEKPWEQQSQTQKRISELKRVAKSFEEDVKSAASKVKSWFGLKEGGAINYLNCFEIKI